jgi:hypothetical protein
MGKVIMAVLVLFLFLGPFREPILDGITGWRTVDTTESFAATTGAGETTENVTLGFDLFQAAVAEVISITSNNTFDAPIALVYYETPKNLTIGGLVVAETHTLTVNYLAETEDTTMRVLGPFLVILIFGFVFFLIFRHATSKGR